MGVVGGEGRVCWAHSQLARASQFSRLLPLPPESPSSGHTSLLAVLYTCPARLSPGFSTFCSLCLQCPFPVLTGPAWTGLRAQLRCPSPCRRGYLPCAPLLPNITWLRLGSPGLCPCSNLAAVDGFRSRADVGIARLLEGELRIPCGFPAWVEG